MGARLPVGTLTLLFSDIEGSTRLLGSLGEAYATVLSRQRSILRDAFARWHGVEMGTEGDSFFVVFAAVGDALAAARDAQRALAEQDWPTGAQVRVRMGLHTGEPARHEDGYVGMDVHRAARVAASAHGGQVVLSEATYRIAAAQALSGTGFRDLGWHRLKDLPEPERLYQLLAPGLAADFAPLRTLGAPSALPVPPTALVGRDRELAELTALLSGPAGDPVRLLTLTGPGGTGKTRLALAVARQLEPRFAGGVYFVPLESARTTETMWSTIAEVLGLSGEGRAPPTMLAQLSRRSVLLVLDNLEQLPADGVVQQILSAAPGVVVLATSRRPLHVGGEHEHPVPPLELPDAAEDAAASGAVQLFVQRARMVRPSFRLTPDNAGDVVEVCRRLDGLPLAIELAAARLKLLSPTALRSRLDHSLELSLREVGRPTRQQTLRSAVAWSYDLLEPRLQRSFCGLGAFGGPADLASVAAVLQAGADPLDDVAELVDASLVAVLDGADGEPRVRMLRTVGDFAREVLAATGERDVVLRRHASHYLSVAEQLAPGLRTSRYTATRDRLESDLDNLRAALGWSLREATPGDQPSVEDVRTGLRLCTALSWFWYACGYASEGRAWLERAVRAGQGERRPEAMGILHSLGVLLLQHGEGEAARAALQTCLDFWRAQDSDDKVAMELNSLAVAHRALGDAAGAVRLGQEAVALARAAGLQGRLASALSNLANFEVDAGTADRAEVAVSLLREAITLDAAAGDTWGEVVGHVNLAAALLGAGRPGDARAQLEAHTDEALALGDVDLSIGVLEQYAQLAAHAGNPLPAARLAGTAAASRARAELPAPAQDAAIMDRALAAVRGRPSPQEWDRAYALGASEGIEDAIALALGRSPSA